MRACVLVVAIVLSIVTINMCARYMTLFFSKLNDPWLKMFFLFMFFSSITFSPSVRRCERASW